MPRVGIPLKKITTGELYQEIEKLKKLFKYHLHQKGETQEVTAADIINQGALATVDAVNNSQILNDAVDELKLADAAVTAAKIAVNAVIEAKITDGAVTANKVATNAITAVKIEAGAVITEKLAANAVTAAKVTTGELITLSAQIKDAIINNAKISDLSADKINAGTLTGITINVNGDALRVRDTSANQVGYLYGYNSSIFRVLAASTSAGGGSVTLELDASSGYIKSRSIYFHPYNDNESYLGGSTTAAGGSLGSDKTWKYIGGQVIDAKDKFKINDIDVIDQSGNTVYIKSGGGGLVLQDGSTTIATFSDSGGIDLAAGKEIDGQYAHLDCVVFANNSPLAENGSIYYNSTDYHFYGRCNGAWRQLDNV